MPTELEIKTDRVAALLRAHGYNGVLLNGQHNFAWITGGASNGVDGSRDPGVASVFVTDQGKRYLLASRIEMPRMLAEEVSANDFEPVEYAWQDEKSDATWLLRRAGDLLGGQAVSDMHFESGIPAIDGLIAHARASLTSGEIERYRSLGRDAGLAIEEVAAMIEPGETELEIASMLRSVLDGYGIRSVVTLVAADDRIAKYRHPVPTSKKFEKTLMLVTCARRHGLTVSLSRLVNVGTVSSELKERTEAAAFVNAALWHATREDADARDIYAIAAKAYDDVGFADEIDKHHQGGATGYRTRDWVIHPNCLHLVQPDQAFAWNPSITGTKVEETVIASGGSCEVITTSPNYPQIVTTIEGIEYSSPSVLEI